MNKDINIMRIDIATQKLQEQLKKDNTLTDYEFVKLINSFDRFQDLIKLIKIK